MEKERIDLLVVQQGLTDSREKAKRMVMAGQVYDQNNLRYDKPGEKVSIETQLHIKGETLKYVSRGGLKLEKALKVFNISVEGENVLDIGSSTGGFTDVALQNGAAHCYALDVGTNQLDWKIRNNDKVTTMEQTNFRYTKLEDFKMGQPTFACMDVSFISLKLILPALKNILKEGGSAVSLIKPQFEAGKDKVGKKGIVSDPQVHEDVLDDILHFANQNGFDVCHLDFSPITGGTGNIEFLAHLVSTEAGALGVTAENIAIRSVIQEANEQLKNKTITLH